MNQMEHDPEATAPLEAVSPSMSREIGPSDSTDAVLDSTLRGRRNLNDPRRILPVRMYRGASLWRKLVALLGLGAFSVLGGLAITLVVGLMAIVAALVLQAVIT